MWKIFKRVQAIYEILKMRRNKTTQAKRETERYFEKDIVDTNTNIPKPFFSNIKSQTKRERKKYIIPAKENTIFEISNDSQTH